MPVMKSQLPKIPMVFAIVMAVIAIGNGAPTPIKALAVRDGPELDIMRAAVHAELFPTIIETHIIFAITALSIVLAVICILVSCIARLSRRLDNGLTAKAEKQALAEANEEKDRYIFSDALAENFPDTVELRYQILGVLFAGRDTTASLISWVFYNLARDPARYLKLRAKGTGPRICPGQQSALTKPAYVVVRLLQRFDRIESWDSEQNAKHNATAAMCSETGVKVKLHTGGAWE
ncbi:hypothetical protein PspLS_11871 [Pyricularia sp. CBS 133598]|nr:hypothetical protein PspLS_11871 [Pyricularia sp. CBS 133598]